MFQRTKLLELCHQEVKEEEQHQSSVLHLQSSVGSASLTGAYAKAGDISGDGKITITDVVQAAQVTVGQRTIN